RILARAINVVRAPSNFDAQVAVLSPSQLLQGLLKRRNAGAPFCICVSRIHEHADASHVLRLLRPRRERPRSRRATEQRYERAASLHSITWSARTRIVWGMVTPRAFAALRFTTISNLAGRSIGRSSGLAPPKNPSNVTAAAPKHIGKVRAIGNKTAGVHMRPVKADRRQAGFYRQFSDPRSVSEAKRIRQNDKGVGSP